ncbi:MAG: hypothetical protein V4552_03135 [Pseudomonadota bacterium]
MAVKSQVNTADGKQNQSNKRLLVMLLIVAILTVWTLLKDDEDTDTIELANPSVVPAKSSLSTPSPIKQENTHKNSLQNKQSSRVFQQQASNSGNAIAWQNLQREPLLSQPHNVFKVHSWLVVPKPIKTKPVPPPPPVAPPAPFTYMGKLENSPQGTQIFLLKNGHLYTAVKGQNIDAQWRLDAEDVNNIQLTYLPLNLPQVLSKMAKSFETTGQPVMADLPTATEMNL